MKIKGGITRSVKLLLTTEINQNNHIFAVSNIGDDDVILELDWIKRENPIINQKQGYIVKNRKRAKINYQSIKQQNKQIKQNKGSWIYNKKQKQWYHTK